MRNSIIEGEVEFHIALFSFESFHSCPIPFTLSACPASEFGFA
jgi:hypothetical protein